MESMQVTTGGTQVAQAFARCVQVSAPSQPALGADLPIYDQVDRIVADKEAYDRWEAEQAACVCGCPHCRSAYRATLEFYATLGAGRPAHERSNTGDLVWYTFHLSGGQPGRT
jgi:hypothetical protein